MDVSTGRHCDAPYRQYEKPICSFLGAADRRPARAQDLAQETFVRPTRAVRWKALETAETLI